MTQADSIPVPPQYKQQVALQIDFRDFGDGPRGYKVGITKKGSLGTKRKLDDYEKQVEEERAAIDEDASPVKLGQIKRPRLNTVGVGKASGRTWKAPAQRASSTKSRTLSSSWEKKMKIKAERDAYNSMKRQAKEARSTRLREARERKEQAEKRKEENRKKSVVVQTLSTETAKRMMKSKKQRKKLATA